MRMFGSIHNRLMEASAQPEPAVGMGVTECLYSDCHAYEVVEVKDSRHIAVRPMKATRTDHNGLSESQDYSYESMPDAPLTHLVFRNGRWRSRLWKNVYEHDADGNVILDGNGDPVCHGVLTNRLGSSGWSLGHMREYRDPCF